MEIKKRIGIKYCGGCNPTYERGEIIQRVQFQLGGPFLFIRYDEKDIDGLITINGCLRACADRELNRQVPYYSLTGESDFDTLVNWLRVLDEKGCYNRFSLSIKVNHF